MSEMRDQRTISRNVRGGATGTVELGAEKPTIAIASPLRICVHRRLSARTPKRPDLVLRDALGCLGEERVRRDARETEE